MKLKLFFFAFFVLSLLIVSFFSTNRLTRFCLYTPLKVLAIALSLSAFFWYVSDTLSESAHVDKTGFDLFFYPFWVVFCCSIASYLLFLLQISSIRDSIIGRIAVFYLLPLVFAGLLIHSVAEYSEISWQTFYYMIAFLIPQTYYYILFEKNRMYKNDRK